LESDRSLPFAGMDQTIYTFTHADDGRRPGRARCRHRAGRLIYTLIIWRWFFGSLLSFPFCHGRRCHLFSLLPPLGPLLPACLWLGSARRAWPHTLVRPCSSLLIVGRRRRGANARPGFECCPGICFWFLGPHQRRLSTSCCWRLSTAQNSVVGLSWGWRWWWRRFESEWRGGREGRHCVSLLLCSLLLVAAAPTCRIDGLKCGLKTRAEHKDPAGCVGRR
jgi:hypothetical protein